MSATDVQSPASSPTPRSRTIDITQTERVSLSTLIKVEIRKMVDTRAGMWLMIAIAAITMAVVTIAWINLDTNDRTFFNLAGLLASPQGMLLPVLGVLLVTQEWGQRTGMVTFTLEPNRMRVIVAKVVAALVFGLAAVLLALGLAALVAALGGAADPFAHVTVATFFKIILLQSLGVLQGVAFGLLILNSAGAIVVFFLVPIAVSLVFNLVGFLRDAAPWIDLGTSNQRLYMPEPMTGEMWAQLGTSTLIWVVLPLVLGIGRVLRAEVK